MLTATGMAAVAAAMLAAAQIGNSYATELTRTQDDLSSAKSAVFERISLLETSVTSQRSRLDQSVSDLKSELAGVEERSRDKLAQVLAEASGSVWLLGVLDEQSGFIPVGTGWTIESGTLATNAHVLNQMSLIASESFGYSLVARSDGNELRLADDFQVHPAYERWSGPAGPMNTQFRRDSTDGLQPLKLISPGDVGLIKVLEGDPGEPLQLAGTIALDPGLQVGYVGYPMENLVGLPSKQGLSGRVTAMTDFFFGSDPTGENLLIHYDAVTLGGSSGSPLLNSRGEVIGMVSSQNAVRLDVDRRIPIGINYAQSSLLLAELLNGTADQQQDERDTRWTRVLAENALPASEVLKKLAASSLGVSEGELQAVASYDLKLDASGGSNHDRYSLRIEPGYEYSIVAVAHDWTDIDLVAVDGQHSIAEDSYPDWYPVITIDAQSSVLDLSLLVWAVQNDLGDPDTRVTLQVFRVPSS